MRITERIDTTPKKFHEKCVRMIFRGHLAEFKELLCYPKAGGGAFGPRSENNPI